MAASQISSEDWLGQLGAEEAGAKKWVYLITFSCLLAETIAAATGELRDLATITRKEICMAVLDAFEKPLLDPAAGGRPRQHTASIVRQIVVFLEKHVDGSTHFHAAVLLGVQMRWSAVKRTLRTRHKLAAHFSCSHTGWWSVLRYGTGLSKKDDVDDKPEIWLGSGETIDIYEESQQPYQAKAWVARRERKDVQDARDDKAAKFSKLDFTSLVLAKSLVSKSQVLRYVQDHGTVAMQTFVNNNQKRINDYLEDSIEWDGARNVAEREDLTNWALLCRAAESECPHGANCVYHKVAEQILDKNAANFRRGDLAAAIRKIIVCGPSKEARVPFCVGATNTGKSTLVDSFDDLFQWKEVFHLPADTDKSFALSNWLKGKRFAYFDEYHPVEYAHLKIISVGTFKKAFGGKYFEIQVPKNWHDGNKDFKWNRGVVFTNKEEGLWNPTSKVSEEDVKHMTSRVEQFRFTHQFVAPGGQPSGSGVSGCGIHLAKWIVDACAAFDVAQGITVLPIAAREDENNVLNLSLFLERVKLPRRVHSSITLDVVALGAIDVQELSQEDWAELPSWSLLKPMERRRLLAMVPAKA